MYTNKITIYIDGAARGNPGPAGIGVLLLDDTEGKERRVIRTCYKYLGKLTNNMAEYMALIYGLQEALMLGYKEVTVKTDSELVVKQTTGEYKVKDPTLRLFYEQFSHLRQGFDRLNVEFVDRKENKDADKLANKAIDSSIDTSIKYE